VFVPLRFEKSGLALPVPNWELPNADEGGGMPFGVKEGRPRSEGGGPAGVVEGMLRNERRSGVEGGSEDSGTANIAMRDGSFTKLA
jgi:hypothetical protein